MQQKQSKENIRVGLALSGGSALGILHIGVLQALEDNDIRIDCVSGTSAGAIVAACYSFGISTAELAEQAEKLSWYKLSSLSYSRMGLTDTKAIGEFLENIIGHVNIEDAKIPLAIVATNITNGEKVVFKKGSVSEAVMSSVSIPGIFVPVEIGDLTLVDGGVVENLPLLTLDDFKPDLKIGVNLARWRVYKKPTNAIDVLLNAFDLMVQKQSIIHSGNAEILIEPHLEKYSPSDFKKAKELIAEGYGSTISMIPEIKQKLGFEESEKFSPQASKPQSLLGRIIDFLNH